MRTAIPILMAFYIAAFGSISARAGDDKKGDAMTSKNAIHVYTLATADAAASFDEAIAVACVQGIINRDGPCVYVLSSRNARPQYWLDTLSQAPGWLAGKKFVPVADLDWRKIGAV